MSTEFTSSKSQPAPITVKPTLMTCNECKHEFISEENQAKASPRTKLDPLAMGANCSDHRKIPDVNQ